MTKVAEKKAEPVAQRKAPEIRAKGFQWQHEGFAFREAFVRLPEGMVAQDLQDHPEAWKQVQAVAPLALRRFDRVTCVAFDESWIVNAVVADANREKVVLAFEKIIKMPGRIAEWEDENYQIKWGGLGYTTYRKRDGVQVTPGFFQTVEGARLEMHKQLYPARVA